MENKITKQKPDERKERPTFIERGQIWSITNDKGEDLGNIVVFSIIPEEEKDDFDNAYGALVILSTPPATISSVSPTIIALAADMLADKLEAHKRFTVSPRTE